MRGKISLCVKISCPLYISYKSSGFPKRSGIFCPQLISSPSFSPVQLSWFQPNSFNLILAQLTLKQHKINRMSNKTIREQV
ncbi:hypothetical protein Hanom_Chr03g00232671 [Helianthus anomalus]